MSTTATRVVEALHELGVAENVRRIADPERLEVLRRITEQFLNEPDVLFWWEKLRRPWSSWRTKHGYKHLPALAPDAEAPCWLVTGLEDRDEGMGVFRCTPNLASSVISACPFFEYAVVDSHLKWMVIENHHDVLFAAGDAAERLDALHSARPGSGSTLS